MLSAAIGLTGCATLPDTDALIERHNAQAANFETARGPVSAKRNAAILAELQRKSGNLDLLDKQMALEQAISDSPLVLGNKARLLLDGAATYAAMFGAIRQAKDHINLETYIIEDDATGQEFSDLLLQAQARGVQVNLIYDSVGAINTPKAFFERLSQAGIAVLEFNPINPLSAKGPWQIYNRDHRKLLIADGRSVILGGINISNVYTSGSAVLQRLIEPPADGGVAWRDTDLQIEGPVVAEFQKLFLQTWEKQKGAPL
ncbi:MAG TPA: phospholipase D-like domain-containing protein, partial [Rhodoferax sp.]|nr:phospholipase D-like domain-containing protein [Rhodoferax sp.]